MARKTIAERMQQLQQQKHKLDEKTAKLRSEERKDRTRRLIEIGGLVAKAGLSQMATNVLYGALLEISGLSDDPAKLQAWETRGGRAFMREARERKREADQQGAEEPARQPSG